MAKAKDKPEAEADPLAGLDAKLEQWSERIANSVTQQLEDFRAETDGKVDALAATLERAIEGGNFDGQLDDQVDGDVDDILPEVREARRLMGRDCPPDIAEIAAALRKRGHRLRLDGLSYATAKDRVAGNKRVGGPSVRRNTGTVRMVGEANRVFDHTGELVAQGKRTKR